MKKIFKSVFKNIKKDSHYYSSNPNLRTEMIEITPKYWKGIIHGADNSIVNVKVYSISNLLERCQKYHNS